MAGLFEHNNPPRTHAPFEFHPSSSLCYRRKSTTTISLMYGSPGHKPQRPLSLSPTKSHTSAQRALSLLTKVTSAKQQYIQTDHERRYDPPNAQVLS